jgi:NADH-quinone oxidoreductase subunit M
LMSNLLLLLPLCLTVCAIFIAFLPSSKVDFCKFLALFVSSFVFLCSLFLWVGFDQSSSKFQHNVEILWLPLVNVNFSLGLDGISLFFVILTALLFPLCLLAGWYSVSKFVKEYLVSFLILEAILLLTFSVSDLLLFYIAFESVLIPMFIIIGV